MLKKIGIENFKAFGKYVEIELDQLNLISGMNSSGKSSIYHALFLLIQSKNKTFEDLEGNDLPYLDLNGDLVKLGKSEEILFDVTNPNVRFTLEWSSGYRIEYIYTRPAYKSIIGHSDEFDEVFFLSFIRHSSGDEEIFSAKAGDEFWVIKAKGILSFGDYDLAEMLHSNIKSSSIEIEEPFFCEDVIFETADCVDLTGGFIEFFYIFFDEVDAVLSPKYREYLDWERLKNDLSQKDIDSDLIALVASRHSQRNLPMLSAADISYIPPFRGYPERVYLHQTNNPFATYLRKVNAMVPFLYDIETQQPLQESLGKAFKYWVVDHFELSHNFSIDEPVEGLVSEIFTWKNEKKIPIINVGFGTSQILPVIYKILSDDKGSIFIIDEPEIHLHPSIQSKLADFFFNMALIGKRLFIETHSEYLIDKLIYLSLKHEEISSMIHLCWVKSSDDGAEVERIQYDDLGYIINAPDGFLNEKQKLVGEISKLRMQKLEMS